MGKYLVIGFCVAIVVLAIYILFKNFKKSLKGGGCAGCSCCQSKDNCENRTKAEGYEQRKNH